MINKAILRISSLILLVTFASCSTSKKEGGEAKAASNDEYQMLFDGKTLTNWKGDPDYWKVEDGTIVGYTTEEKPLEANTFLIWDGGQPADFELIVDFRITESGNSGIQYRSEMVEGVPFGLKGYQADIDGKNNYTGQNYEERKRATLAYRGQQVIVNSQEDPNAEVRDNVKKNAWQSTEIVSSLGDIDVLKTKINSEDWNECKLIINGNLLQHYINGVLMSEVTDNDTVNRMSEGLLGFQIHRGPPMKVEYKNIRYKAL